MAPRTSSSSLRRLVAAATAACAILAFAAAGSAAAGTRSDPPIGKTRTEASTLSNRLATLASPAVRSESRAAQAKALSLPATGPGSLLRVGNRVLVEIRFASGAAMRTDDLRAVGARVVDVSPRYRTVTAAVAPRALHQVAAVAGVANVMEVLTPMTAEPGVATSNAPGPMPATRSRPSATARRRRRETPNCMPRTRGRRSAWTAPPSRSACSLTGTTTHSPTRRARPRTSLPATSPGLGQPMRAHDGRPGPQRHRFGRRRRGPRDVADRPRPRARSAPSFATAFTGDLAFANNIRALKASERRSSSTTSHTSTSRSSRTDRSPPR